MNTDDPLDDLLSPKDDLRLDAGKADAFLRATARVVDNRRRLRNLRTAGLWALFFAAGMGAMYAVRPTKIEKEYVYVTVKERAVAKAETEAPRSAVELERLAERTFEKAKAAELFRLAGNRYYRQEQDMDSALRCYRFMLSETSAATVRLTEQDSWLLASLVESRKKEIAHANVEN